MRRNCLAGWLDTFDRRRDFVVAIGGRSPCGTGKAPSFGRLVRPSNLPAFGATRACAAKPTTFLHSSTADPTRPRHLPLQRGQVAAGTYLGLKHHQARSVVDLYKFLQARAHDNSAPIPEEPMTSKYWALAAVAVLTPITVGSSSLRTNTRPGVTQHEHEHQD